MEELNELLPQKQKKEDKYGDLKNLLKLYVVPILTVLIFVGVLLFAIVPKISNMIGDLETIDTLNAELDQKNQDIAELERLDQNVDELNRNIDILNSIAPETATEVVSFRDKIAQLATSLGVEVVSQNLGEAETEVQNPQNSLILKEVPTTFVVSGTYSNIIRFINELDSFDDFIVFKQFSLAKESTNQDGSVTWGLGLTLVKYQFGEETDELRAQYSLIPANARINSKVQEYIDERK